MECNTGGCKKNKSMDFVRYQFFFCIVGILMYRYIHILNSINISSIINISSNIDTFNFIQNVDTFLVSRTPSLTFFQV